MDPLSEESDASFRAWAGARQDRLDERRRFQSEFRTNKQGNPWRIYLGKLLTVFPRRDGRFGWVISDDGEPEFSRRGYESQEDAIEALGAELGIGEG